MTKNDVEQLIVFLGKHEVIKCYRTKNDPAGIPLSKTAIDWILISLERQLTRLKMDEEGLEPL